MTGAMLAPAASGRDRPSTLDPTEDILDSLRRQAERLYIAAACPGTGRFHDAAELDVAPGGDFVLFTASFSDDLESPKRTDLCELRIGDGELSRLSPCETVSRKSGTYGPCGTIIACLRDWHGDGHWQLELLDRARGLSMRPPALPGSVEYLRWSPCGRRLLVGTVGPGGDRSSVEGAVRRTAAVASGQPWEPRIDRGRDEAAWRRLLIYSLDTESWEPAINGPVTVWEADWCGDHAIAAIVSDDQGEGAWFDARLELFALGASGGLRPSGALDQLGWVRGSADGKWVAIVDAVCSDRWVVAGDLILIEAGSNSVHRIDCGFDVTHVEWRGADHLLVAGVDGLESVAAMVTPSSRQTTELWRSQTTSVAGHSVKIAGRGDSSDFVLAGEGFAQAPEIALVSQGLYRCLYRLYADQPGVLPAFDVRAMEWRAGDGLNIEGWLLTPAAPPPWPLVVQVHGGPVAHWRSAWLGRRIPSALLLSSGFAVLLANPRGSSGRGRTFAGAVRGDMGGADAEDLVSGVEELIAAGLVDPARIGITGVSYGGFMTAWLLTQSRRFAAGVSVAPIINHQTHRLLSNISRFSELFVGAPEKFPDGPWRERSPLFFARQVQVPTLTICGALDRCTPPIEAEQFHAALRSAGAVSELVTYPLEGHGIRGFPAAIDYAARLVAWFVTHMPAQSFEYSGHSRR